MGYKISTMQKHATREHRPAQTWICWLDVWNKVKHILPNGGLMVKKIPWDPNPDPKITNSTHKKQTGGWLNQAI